MTKIEKFLSNLDEAKRNVLINNLKRSNVLFGESCKGLDVQTYEMTKRIIPELFYKGDYEGIIKKLFWVADEAIDKLNEVEMLSFILWVKDELETIAKLEEEFLASDPDADLINAGVRELDMFGDKVLIDTLAGGDITKWKEVLNLPYHFVFYKLAINNKQAKINKNYHKIISDKQKRK